MRKLNLDEVRRWRADRASKGLSSSFADYHRAHDICMDCKGDGIRQWSEHGTMNCQTCNGTGKFVEPTPRYGFVLDK